MKKFLLIILLAVVSTVGRAQESNKVFNSTDTTHAIHYDKVFVYVDEDAEYPGGDSAMQYFLKDNLRFPLLEREKGINGTVYISFVIDQTGRVTDVKELKGVPDHPNFSIEAINVIKQMPKWKPAKMNGRVVKVEKKIPVKFLTYSLTYEEGKATNSNRVYSFVEHNPTYPGGFDSLKVFVNENARLPFDSIIHPVVVRLNFVVENDGTINDINTLNIDYGDLPYSIEAKRLIGSMKQWNPGKFFNKEVPVRFNIGFRFNRDKTIDVLELQEANRKYISGNQQLQNGNYFVAEQLYSEAISILPTADLYFNRSIARGKLGKKLESCADLFEAGYLDDTQSQRMFIDSCKEFYSSFQLTTDPTFLEESYFRFVETLPSFPGGVEALMGFMRSNLKYPLDAADAGIQGTVLVTFVITKLGQIEDVSVLKGVSRQLDAESLRLISKMPNWIPATTNGKPIDAQFSLPIKFALH